MANFSTILANKLTSGVNLETNLEQGEIFTYMPNRFVRGPLGPSDCMVWKSPGSGTAVIEVWGAGGSSGKMCCCGAGIPGNPGAYAKKTVRVDSSTFIRGFPGLSCSNDNLCFKGCSDATCIHICSPNGLLVGSTGGPNCICICAEGGVGGMTYCSGSSQNACCYSANGYCFKNVNCSSGAACFLVCNLGVFSGRCAYGGDVNCHSGTAGGCNFSCTSFYSCYDYKCDGEHQHVAFPPGIISEKGGVVTFQRECYSNSYDGTGDCLSQLLGALNFAGRTPQTGGQNYTSCWSGSRQCGCYEDNHCTPMLPFGVPGFGANAEAGVRDYGVRGGHGAVRIKFIAS